MTKHSHAILNQFKTVGSDPTRKELPYRFLVEYAKTCEIPPLSCYFAVNYHRICKTAKYYDWRSERTSLQPKNSGSTDKHNYSAGKLVMKKIGTSEATNISELHSHRFRFSCFNFACKSVRIHRVE